MGGSGSVSAGSPSGVSSTGPGTGGKAGRVGVDRLERLVQLRIERRQRLLELGIGDDRRVIGRRRGLRARAKAGAATAPLDRSEESPFLQ